jgi:hypothetical protein
MTIVHTYHKESNPPLARRRLIAVAVSQQRGCDPGPKARRCPAKAGDIWVLRRSATTLWFSARAGTLRDASGIVLAMLLLG